MDGQGTQPLFQIYGKHGTNGGIHKVFVQENSPVQLEQVWPGQEDKDRVRVLGQWDALTPETSQLSPWPEWSQLGGSHAPPAFGQQ